MYRTKLPPKRGGRTSYPEIQILNPGKGLNNLISDNLIDDKEASSLENIMFVESGAPAKAYGYTSVGTGLSNSPRGMGFFNDTIAGNRDLLTVDGTDLKYLSGTTWTAIAGASFDSSGQINFTQVRGSMYVYDGVNPVAKLATGRTLTRNGHSPKAKFGIFFKGYHIIAGVDGQPNRLYVSKSTDASEFTVATGGTQPQPDNSNDTDSGVANVPGASAYSLDSPGTANARVFDISKFDGDKITGLVKYQDVLIVFKERSIYQLDFATDGLGTVSSVSNNYGAVSHRSIDNVENDVFFLSRNGVYVLGNEPNYINVIRTNELSARIHPLFEAINPTQYAKCTAMFNQYVYYLGVPNGGVSANNMTISYDRRFLAWSKLTHIAPEAFTVYTDSSNTDYVYFTSSTTAKVYKMTSNYDADGSAISAQWTSKAFDLGDFSGYKRWITLDILFRQIVGVINVNIYTDNGVLLKSQQIGSTTTGGMGTNSLGGGDWLGGTVSSSSTSASTASTNIPYRFKISTKSRSIKIQVSNTRVNETFVILGLKLRYRPLGSFIFPSSLKVN